MQELERLLNSPDASVRNHAAERLFPGLLAKNAQAAARLAESVTDQLLKDQLLRSVAVAWAERDPAAALSWAETQADPNDRELTRVMALTQISNTDPKTAVLLRQQHSATAPEDAELANLAQRWAEKDLTAALQWADSLPPGEQRDLVTARAAFVQARTSPHQAAQLILDRISSPEAQREALLSVLNRWAQRDFDAASDWVAQLVDSPLKHRAETELRAVAQSAGAGSP